MKKPNQYMNIPESCKKKAVRTPVELRYDLLEPSFLAAMAKIAHYGTKYDDELVMGRSLGQNYKKSRLMGEKSPVNHIYKHLGEYSQEIDYNHTKKDGTMVVSSRKMHLVAIAFNAMMEYWYEEEEGK